MCFAFVFVVAVLQASTGVCQEQSQVAQETALEAVCQSVAVAGALLAENPAELDLVHHGGCFIWQQPGVALAVTGVWQEGDEPKLYYNPAKLEAFFAALPDYCFEEPFPDWALPGIFPGEAGNPDEFEVAPAAYLLNGDLAQARLARYYSLYLEQAEFFQSAPLVWDKQLVEALAVDYAVVYIDSAGPLEFYFTRDANGKPALQHLILWNFFSA